ncbi:acetyltransferase [Candidatus Planktophila lacus]|jgi:GNAT superfamily N-acetyltransferase|uniref:GNAT family N-acetyltransferase n=1 Tax=Candidatus Planktophila lacus TaxID=1884913 RepID=UPI000BACB1C7|nr:GNAT family N-acetyltransferase [Candidatus Planktophila lacus]ASY25368.1 acetyltransferase [Candidatus Planktophila lacus]
MSPSSQKSQPNLAAAIGARVTVRLHEATGGFRDVVGILQRCGDGVNELLNSKGQIISFSEDEIAIWREIRPLPDRAGTGAPFSLRIQELEHLSDLTWPADEIKEIGKWRLRISDGFTMRANSVLPTGAAPFGEPNLDLSKAVDEVVKIYQEKDLTPTFTLPLPLYEELDNYLAGLGWKVKIGAEYLINDIPDNLDLESVDFQIVITSEPTPEWLALQSDHQLERIMRNYPAHYAEIKFDNQTVAIGRIATFGKWSLATRVFVNPEFRGKGIGTLLMRALMAAAKGDGATKVGLQVDSENGAGLALYKSMGFRFHHFYNYRVLSDVSK